jgi:hypothetical protein
VITNLISNFVCFLFPGCSEPLLLTWYHPSSRYNEKIQAFESCPSFPSLIVLSNTFYRKKSKLNYCIVQGWATLFDSWATLVTNLVDAGQYKYNKDLFDMTFEKKCAYRSPFSQKKRL